ncbi:MAG: hemolysin III family protein [Opitutaceae bacterium]|nr:hemolysin III family protein [Opitutaceae bacterium]
MSDLPSSRARIEEQFSLPLFLLTIAATLGALAGLLKLVAPDAVWQAQLAGGAWRFAAAFLVIHLFTAFIEFVFHRYVLHKPVVPLLSRFYRQHTLHHSLTRIGKRYTSAGREVPFVENVYPVTTPEQGEASFFPWYTLAVFAALVTPLLALLHWIAPAFPWFIAGYAALAFALALYEIFHAIEHWSFERWAPLIEHRTFGWFWRKVYSFHLRHHAVIDCNEAISGFFTLPVFDWVFGTFILPKSLYVTGTEWKANEFASPRPVALIRWCDEKSDALVKARRAAAAPKSAPAGYTRGEQIAHTLTHGAGLAASIAAFVLLVVFAALRGGGRDLAGAILFGAGLVAVYAAFARFRKQRPAHWREVFHRYTHGAIFLLIAGTATPFLLRGVGGAWGWSLIGVVWGLCAIGAGARLFWPGRMQLVSRGAYLLLALVALIALKPLVSTVPQGAVWLLLAGGLCYACGAAFQIWQRVRYHQVMRHAFALGGSACHIVAVLIFVLPRAG